ncbi:ferritin-like domain-containing protein [Actinomadura flavalba]|uniref:ferritin-like domain-containing protein n=1 Tax=Actinomadura flavalba TaxID=1120938 RepID=UPI0003741AEC|nr:ferritin-like domain-containing protein [Actinomadura flavalba]
MGNAWEQWFAVERPVEPDWGRGARLPGAVVRSVRKFQVGEDGDGRHLIGKADAAGDAGYATAVRAFVAEEREHARLLARVLGAAGAPLRAGHWTDAVFVRLRRLLGLRLELLVLMVAEVVALRYYRALRDGCADALTAEVAGVILADEERHVPFHCARLRPVPAPVRGLWQGLLAGAAVVVAVDHGGALRACGVGRAAFVRAVLAEGRRAAALMR